MADRQGIGDVLDLVKAYAKQETLGPLKGTARWLGFGVLGSVLLMIGGLSLTLALLRVLQEETGSRFTGNWSWAPYLLTVLVLGLVIGVLVSRITKRSL
jgi:hypothetical protein